MSVLNLSGDEAPECPLCMELFELDDINFYPCSCGYQICRFCWNKLRTEGNGLCPACRQPYTENPADFKPLTSEEMAKIKAEKRQKDQAKKQKITENRKHLANVRVVQKNLVFVVGLSPRLADPEILKKPDYFGKFGKIHKVVINHSTQYAGSQIQGPSASAYVTYLRSEDALRAIQAVNNIFIDGRTLKASLGTTKYCSHFMKNQPCPKNDCMYLHELGDEHASFTKEQMQQGKHTEYEKSLHEELDSMSQQPPSPSPDLGQTGEGEWSSSWGRPSDSWGSGSRLAGDSWGSGGGGDEWGGGQSGGGDQAWPDLGHGGLSSYKGRYISKDDQDKSKSKSCSSSDCDSSSLAADTGVDSDQVVPVSSGHSGLAPGQGLADAAWEDREPSTRAETQSPGVISDQCSGDQLSLDTATVETRQESGWLDNDLKSSNTFLDDDDVDDLGFDPFHETQKGLADLLESEAAAQAQVAQHQVTKVASPPPGDWRGQPGAAGAGGPSPVAGAGAQSRVKLPPPGFHNSSAAHLPSNSMGGTYNQGGYGGPLNIPPSPATSNITSNPVDSLFGLRPRSGPAPGYSGHSGHQQPGGQEMMFGLGNKTGGLDLGSNRLDLASNRLGLGGLGLGDRLYEQKQNHLGGPSLQDNGFSKDWQDGLRALLPNVNVSFGLNSQAPGPGGPPHGHNNTGHFGLGNMHQPSFSQHQERQQQLQSNSNWGAPGLSNGLGNDWTMLDPAIVSGQLANNLEPPPSMNHLNPAAAGRSESPSNWISANLEQLTEGGYGQNSLIPQFNGLGLGDRHGAGSRQGQQQGRLGGVGGVGGWGGGLPGAGLQGGGMPGPASTATPPPGFSHHRQPLGQHYQGFSGVNKGSEAHKIGEF